MSQPMKILLGVVGVLLLASVGLTMFGKPPNLPLGPLQGVFASDDAETIATDGAFTDQGAGFGSECAPGAGAGTDPLADPAAGGAIDPATGAPAAGSDPAAGAIDPATGAPAAGATDPATGAPVASGAEGWDGNERVVAASAGSDYDAGRVSDSHIVAAEAVDPTTGLPVDPATGAATDPAAGGATDPAAGGATDPAAGGAATDPLADPAAGAGVDPCADPTGAGAGAGTDPLADPAAGLGAGGATDPGAGAAPGAGAGAGTGAGAPAAGRGRTTTDGTNSGNSPEALRAAKDATSVMQKAKISVSTTATLVPSAGGIGSPAAVKRYRGTVTAAVLVMKLDAAAQQQWTGAGKKVQGDLVKSFLTRLGKSYPKASRSVTVVDEGGSVLAVGDAPPRSAGRVKLF